MAFIHILNESYAADSIKAAVLTTERARVREQGIEVTREFSIFRITFKDGDSRAWCGDKSAENPDRETLVGLHAFNEFRSQVEKTPSPAQRQHLREEILNNELPRILGDMLKHFRLHGFAMLYHACRLDGGESTASIGEALNNALRPSSSSVLWPPALATIGDAVAMHAYDASNGFDKIERLNGWRYELPAEKKD